MNIEKTKHINNLLDIYGELLTDYQKEIMNLYYQEDLSLKEIAEEKEVSRNAIFTLITRVEKILLDYEEKLHLLDKRNRVQNVLDNNEISSDIKKSIEDILDE